MKSLEMKKLAGHWLSPVVVAIVLTAVGYANAPGGQFVFDDLFLVRDAGHIRDFGSVFEMLRQMKLSEGMGYRPVRNFTHMLEYQVFGLRPWGYHLTNMALHMVVCLLLFRLVRRMGLDLWVALAGMALFAVHPVHTEAVTYISGRRDLLYTAFYIGAMLAYVRGVQDGRRRWVILALVQYVLGIFSKEMAITLPAVLYLWDVLLNRREEPWRKRLVAPFRGQPVFWAVLWAGAIAYFLYRGILVPRTLHPSWWGDGPASNFATVVAVHLRYLAVQMWPVDLLADYSPLAFPIAKDFTDQRTVIGLLVVAGTLAVAFTSRDRWPVAALAILSYWIVLLPVSHIIPHHELAAEHHLYLPSAGICFAAGAGLVYLGRSRRRFATTLFALLVVAFVGLTLSRNEDWRTEETLWSATVASAPRCGRALLNLASVHLDKGELDAGEALLRRSMLYTDHPKTRAYLGTVLTRKGRYEEADGVLGAAYARYPEDRFVIRFYALNLRHLGREDDAQEILARGLRLYPWDPDMHFILAGSLVMQDRPEQALEEYLEALDLRPADEDSRKAAIMVARTLGRETLARSLESGKTP